MCEEVRVSDSGTLGCAGALTLSLIRDPLTTASTTQQREDPRDFPRVPPCSSVSSVVPALRKHRPHLVFLSHSPKRTNSKPRKRNRKASRENKPSRPRSLPSLILRVLTKSSNAPDYGEHKECESSHFQPKLTSHPPKGSGSGLCAAQHRATGAAVAHPPGNHLRCNRYFSQRRDLSHGSILAVQRRTMLAGEITAARDLGRPRRSVPRGFRGSATEATHEGTGRSYQ